MKLPSYRPQKTHIKAYLFGVVFIALVSTMAIHPNLKQAPASSSSNVPTAVLNIPTKAPNTTSTTPAPTPSTSQVKASAAQDEAAAAQDVKSAQNINQSMASEAATCTQNQQAIAQEKQIQAEMVQLTNQEETEQQQEASGPTNGETLAQFLAYYNNLNVQNSNQSATLKQQFNAAAAAVGGC